MPDGTSVGNVYLDLVVRDTIVKQIQEISDRARSAAQKQFSDMGKSLGDAMGKTMTQGMENASRNLSQTVNGAFSKSVALLQAKIKELAFPLTASGTNWMPCGLRGCGQATRHSTRWWPSSKKFPIVFPP